MKNTLKTLLSYFLMASCTMKNADQPDSSAYNAGDCSPQEVQPYAGEVPPEQAPSPNMDPKAPMDPLFAPPSGELMYDPGSDLPRGYLLYLGDEGGL